MSTLELFAHLCVSDVSKAIAFYTKAFGATERFRLVAPDGRVGHAELAFGGATLMLAEPFPEIDIHDANHFGGTPTTIHLHVENADETIARAVEAGAEVTMEPRDQFYGERSGAIRDPFGHRWTIGHSIEDVSVEEMQRRYDAMG